MKKDVLKEEIIRIFTEKLGWKKQTVRDNVSRFKIKECPHATQNAAAHVLALTKGFSCRKRLKKEDLSTVPSNISEILQRYKPRSKKETNSENNKPNFKRKIKGARTPLERDAWKNAEVYPEIYILENSLRGLILNQLGENRSWWKKPEVTQRIIDYAKNIEDEEKAIVWRRKRGKHPIYFITLKHLCKIIQMNWSKFKKFGDQNRFLARIEDLFPIRHGLAHHVPLSLRDKKEVEISVDKICKLIKSKY